MCNCCNCNKSSVIRTIDDLEKIREAMKAKLALRTRTISSETTKETLPGKQKEGTAEIALCLGTSCISSGADKVKAALIDEIDRQGLQDRIHLIEAGCNGFCAAGPLMVIYPGGYLYLKVTPDDIPEIISEHILNNRPVERLMFNDPVTGKAIPFYNELPFFAPQDLRVLRNKAIISAESIEEYIGRDGYFALARALTEYSPEKIIDEVKASGIRGRGGAGFSTGMKWEFCRKAPGDKKYILCNADEGDPGAFMDRSLLESDPHAVLEGMMIGALAIGATEGYVYCRAEYPLALHRLNCAIEACRRYGLLGKNILGTDFSLDIYISQGSGAFVCGEETALMRSIEGKRGEPRPRPPFPALKGLWDKPTVLNNVETFGNIPLIIRNGSDWYRTAGTDKSPGTKIFALAGAIKHAGLIEVPIGTPLGQLIYDIGGGIPNGKQFKAAQIGGPSGGCVPRQHLNVPLDYESLNELGAIMGSGGLVVMDEDTCMVDVARYFLEFVQEESCGKCVPCRVGTKRMLEILNRICEGKGEESDIDKLIELGNRIKDTALCGLGQTAPNPVLSTIRYFRHEYEAHILQKHCEAGVCPELVRAPCQSACPASVNVPGFISLIGEKRYDEAIRLHRERNPLASICARVCFHPCESKCRRSTLDDPVAIRGVKRFMVDQEITVHTPEIRPDEENAKRKIAVIGAGPAGLSCAYFLARMGYRPKVFEAESWPGGMLVQAIPEYRLPRDILGKEIHMIEAMGVEIRTNQKLGRDFTLSGLRDEGYEAVFLGIGAPKGISMDIPGSESIPVIDALDFLREFNLRGKADIGEKVIVVGGGNAAIDAARTAVRLGSEATIVYRRTRGDMPAFDEEIEEAIREGVKLETLMNPEEITENGNGMAVKCSVMELGDYDSTGRRRPVKNGKTCFIEGDQIICAFGQTLDIDETMDSFKLETKGSWIKTDPVTCRTSMPWIFAGGDATTGPKSVVDAIAAGERSAVSIDEYLTGETHAFWRQEKPVDTAFDPDADPVYFARGGSVIIPVEDRRLNFCEVEQSWHEGDAIKQAQRCLRCDYGKC